jgi:hypothetical protein
MRRVWTSLAIALVGLTCSAYAEDLRVDNCATKLVAFIRELDDLLASHPRDINVIHTLIHHHIPVQGCTADVAARALETSVYFKGEERVGRSTQFSLFSGNTSSRGAAILLVLDEDGNWKPPFAMWYPPYP